MSGKNKPLIGKINKKALVVGVATAVASGLIIKELSKPKQPGDAERPGEWKSPFERFGGILGSNGGETYPGESFSIPQQQPVIFPSEAPFDFSAFFRGEDPRAPKRAKTLPESQQTAYNILSAIGFGGGVYTPPTTKKTPTPLATMGAAMQTSYATKGKGLGGLTALREPRISKVRGDPPVTPMSKKESARAPVAAALGRAGGGISSVWGAMKTSYATGGKGAAGSVRRSTSSKAAAPKKAAAPVTSRKRIKTARSVGVGSFRSAASRFTGGY